MYFLLNCQIREFVEPPLFTRNWAPLISGCNPKFKNPALDCCWPCWKVSKMVCHNLIAQKLTKKIGSLEMDFCQTRDLVVDPWVRSPTQLYNFCCLLTVKIWPRFNLPVKRYSIYAHRQTHRQTDRHTFCIPIGGDEIFLHMEIYTCHFSMFIRSLCSLIHFVCEGYFKIFM